MQNSYASERSAYPTAMVVNIHHKPTWKDDNVLVPKAGLRVPVVNIPQRRPNYSERKQIELNYVIVEEGTVKSDIL